MIMTTIEELKAMHEPLAYDGSHVYEIWNDGEITLQKAGELYGQRNVHQIKPPFEGFSLQFRPDVFFPYSTGYSRLGVSTLEKAIAIRQIMEEILS